MQKKSRTFGAQQQLRKDELNFFNGREKEQELFFFREAAKTIISQLSIEELKQIFELQKYTLADKFLFEVRMKAEK